MKKSKFILLLTLCLAIVLSSIPLVASAENVKTVYTGETNSEKIDGIVASAKLRYYDEYDAATNTSHLTFRLLTISNTERVSYESMSFGLEGNPESKIVVSTDDMNYKTVYQYDTNNPLYTDYYVPDWTPAHSSPYDTGSSVDIDCGTITHNNNGSAIVKVIISCIFTAEGSNGNTYEAIFDDLTFYIPLNAVRTDWSSASSGEPTNTFSGVVPTNEETEYTAITSGCTKEVYSSSVKDSKMRVVWKDIYDSKTNTSDLCFSFETASEDCAAAFGNNSFILSGPKIGASTPGCITLSINGHDSDIIASWNGVTNVETCFKFDEWNRLTERTITYAYQFSNIEHNADKSLDIQVSFNGSFFFFSEDGGNTVIDFEDANYSFFVDPTGENRTSSDSIKVTEDITAEDTDDLPEKETIELSCELPEYLSYGVLRSHSGKVRRYLLNNREFSVFVPKDYSSEKTYDLVLCLSNNEKGSYKLFSETDENKLSLSKMLNNYYSKNESKLVVSCSTTNTDTPVTASYVVNELIPMLNELYSINDNITIVDLTSDNSGFSFVSLDVLCINGISTVVSRKIIGTEEVIPDDSPLLKYVNISKDKHESDMTFEEYNKIYGNQRLESEWYCLDNESQINNPNVILFNVFELLSKENT